MIKPTINCVLLDLSLSFEVRHGSSKTQSPQHPITEGDREEDTSQIGGGHNAWQHDLFLVSLNALHNLRDDIVGVQNWQKRVSGAHSIEHSWG
jgi:hypothetical protein